MISIDETFEEPNWLRYEEGLAGFCRLIRFDALGLGLSDPFASGVHPSIEGWAHDALAVLVDVGSERAVMLAPSGGTLPAFGWPPITPRESTPSFWSMARHESSVPRTTQSASPRS